MNAGPAGVDGSKEVTQRSGVEQHCSIQYAYKLNSPQTE